MTDTSYTRPDPPASLPMAQLEAQIVELSSQLTAAGARLTCLIGEFDDAEGWRPYGLRSTAHWLSWKCGMGLGAAREQVRVARALRDLPLMRGEYRAARLSYSKVRALTRIAAADTEATLVEIAEHATAAQVEALVARDRRAVRAEDTRARREGEFLRYHQADDGSLLGSFRISPERALTVLHGLDAEAERVSDPVGEGDADEPAAERRARRSRVDGLVGLCERALAGQFAAAAGDGGELFQLVIHAPVDALSRGDDADDDGPAVELHAPGGATVRIGPATTRRLSCDCRTTVMVDGVDGSAVHVGRRTSRIRGRLRRAVNARDRGRCRAPGCTQRATQIHHIRHWADGGATCLGNLISLCDQHHWLVHEGGFALVVRSPGRWALIGRGGVTVEPEPPLHEATDDLPHDPGVASDAVTGLWAGDRLSYPDVLHWLGRARTTADVSAETSEPPEVRAGNVSAETSTTVQFSKAEVESWFSLVDRLEAVSRDPRTQLVYVDDE
jgi:hypothetical protein